MTEQVEVKGKGPGEGGSPDGKEAPPEKQDKPKKGEGKPVKPGKKAAKPQREELAERVSSELAKVRGLLREVGDAALVRLDGEVTALSLYLTGQGFHGEKPVLPPCRELEAMLAELAALKVKPKKGRVKDLARIDALLESLSQRMPPGV